MKFVNPTTEPLGLTRGSIRGILALIVTLATIAAILATLSQAAIAPGAVLLANLDVMVLKDYFEKRDVQPSAPAPDQA